MPGSSDTPHRLVALHVHGDSPQERVPGSDSTSVHYERLAGHAIVSVSVQTNPLSPGRFSGAIGVGGQGGHSGLLIRKRVEIC